MNYKTIKNTTYKEYKKIGSVFCPYLETEVAFTARGFWHMIYTSRNKKRDNRSQKLRFRLFPTAVKIISLTTTLQEIEIIKHRLFIYYGFIAIIDGWKVKAIVKKNGKGQPYFWSVIPNWMTNRKRDRLLFKGNMEAD